MSYVFNMVGGGSGSGGPSASDAILTVTVPTGSTVTMTKGGLTLTPTMWVQAADNTLDCALFVISPSLFDSQNAWNVTATLWRDTASDTVTIDSNEQYDVVLSYSLYLFKAGSGPAANWGYVKESSATINFTNQSLQVNLGKTSLSYCKTRIYTINKVDVTDYNTVVMDARIDKVFGGSNLNPKYVVSSNIATVGIDAEYDKTVILAIDTAPEVRELYVLDVSQITGEYYVGVAQSWSGEIFNVYLSKNEVTP